MSCLQALYEFHFDEVEAHVVEPSEGLGLHEVLPRICNTTTCKPGHAAVYDVGVAVIGVHCEGQRQTSHVLCSPWCQTGCALCNMCCQNFDVFYVGSNTKLCQSGAFHCYCLCLL